MANKATSVLDCLRAACTAAGWKSVECEVAAVGPRAEARRSRLADGRFERADAVIVAVGGSVACRGRSLASRSRRWAAGHRAARAAPLDNIRVRGALELWRPGGRRQAAATAIRWAPTRAALGVREVGEVMFASTASGIAAFNLSRLAEPGDVLAVDFVPGCACATWAFLNRRRKMLHASLGHDVTWDDMLRGMVLAPVADVLLEAAALDGARPWRRGTMRMAPVLKGLRLP
ncbi:MAG: hypothetical protein ACLUW6_10060 [Coriobacteriaceae bacterium]